MPKLPALPELPKHKAKHRRGPLGGWIIHLFVYVAVCGFLVCAWALLWGSFAEVSDIAHDPSLARELDFWPIWVILGWGVALVIHLGVALVSIPSAIRARNRRRRDWRARTREGVNPTAQIAAQLGEEVMQRAMRGFEAIAAKRRSKPPSTPARKWVSVMFTDIAESTSLTEALGDDEWAKVLAQYRGLVRAAFASRGGEEVGTQGDGFLGQFPSPNDAVLCGVDIQREIDKVHRQVDFDLKVRIGIHAGEAVEDDGDLVGRVVNLASRVTSAAEPGEILVTEPVADHLDGGLRLEDRGLRELRGVPQPRHLLAVNWDHGSVRSQP